MEFFQLYLFQGPVRFYNNERKANILINQFQLGQVEKIGEYHSQLNHLDLTLGKPVRWVSIHC